MVHPSKALALVATCLIQDAAAIMGNSFEMYSAPFDDTGVMRADPIMNGDKTSPHVHEFFGSEGMSPDQTADSLMPNDKSTIMGQCTTMGDAKGRQVSSNKSVYWHPALYMELLTGGFLRVPTVGRLVYYKDIGHASDKKREPFEFPKGFTMVAGDANLRTEPKPENAMSIEWACGNKPSRATSPFHGFEKLQGVTQMLCGTTVNGVPNQFPYYVGALNFPHCFNEEAWNAGERDTSKFMAYPEAADYVPAASVVEEGKCPTGFVRVPHVYMEVKFDINSIAARVKPNSQILATGDRTGYGWHGDYQFGWEPNVLSTLMSQCTTPGAKWDIGECANLYTTNNKQTSECKLKVPDAFKEKVDEAVPNLPGCNPAGSATQTDRAKPSSILPIGADNSMCTGVPLKKRELTSRHVHNHARAHSRALH